jgi:hypothetical protein
MLTPDYIEAIITNIKSGYGYCNSAHKGAKIPDILAKKLQIPNDVVLKSYGNEFTFTIVSTLYVAATPSLEPNKKNGTRLVF